MRNILPHPLITLVLIAGASRASAQGTAFTYQGQLQSGGRPANGTYNLSFSLFNVNVGSTSVAGPVVDNGVVVSNSLFAATLDFGSSAFGGATNWLEVSVESNGATSFTTLAPRQQLTPTPYSIFAETASNLSGTLSVSQLAGTIPQQQLPDSVIIQSESGVSLTGTFYGDGGGLTNTVTSGNYLSASSSVSQPVNTANTFQNIQFDTVNANGWTYFGGGSDTFTCQQTGTYLVQYGAEVATTGSAALITLRAFNNTAATEILGSEATTTLLTATEPNSVSRSFLVACTIGTLLQFQFTAGSTSAELVAGSGAGAAKPCFSCTFVRIQ